MKGLLVEAEDRQLLTELRDLSFFQSFLPGLVRMTTQATTAPPIKMASHQNISALSRKNIATGESWSVYRMFILKVYLRSQSMHMGASPRV